VLSPLAVQQSCGRQGEAPEQIDAILTPLAWRREAPRSPYPRRAVTSGADHDGVRVDKRIEP